MASTSTVKRALAALAAGHGFVSNAESDDPPAARVVAEAETAVERLDTAADRLAGDRETRLRRAVDRAERRDIARRGQRVLATVERFRAVAADTDLDVGDGPEPPEGTDPRTADGTDPMSTCDRSGDDERHRSPAPSRETVKRTGGQRPDR